MNRLKLRRQTVLIVAAVVLALLLALGLDAVFGAGLFDGLELDALDLAFRLRGAQPPGTPVVVVAIDDITFANTRLQWPWPRTYFAQIVDRLAAGGAKVIALDVFFFEPEGPDRPATYTVQGDTLSAIAERFGVSPQALAEANGLGSGGRLCPGQRLTIPTTPATQYTVQLDSVEAIAERYGVEVAELTRLNGLADPCDARPADLLLIPVRGPVEYTLREGDSLLAISGLFQVNPLAILSADGEPARDPLTPGEAVTVQLGDAALAASIRAAGNVILNGEISTSTQAGGVIETLGQPIPPLREGMAGFGLTNIRADSNGVVHTVPAWLPRGEQVYYTWAIAAASLYTGQPLDSRPGADSFTFGETPIALTNRYLHINFRGPEGAFPTYSALQVVNGDLPLDTFRDKVVFVGATSESLHDTYPTPFDPDNPMPGVEVMANVFDTLVAGRYLARSPAFGGLTALSIVAAGVVALALALIRRPMLAIGVLAGLMTAYALAWLGAFLLLRVEIPVVAPELALFLAFVVPAAERAVSEELEKRRVRAIFERFISPEMVEQLIERGIEASRGQRRELTILFSDIRGFTSISEKMTPDEVVELLNEYLGVMTEVLLRHGGTVDKYEGDLIMAFFGAPIPYDDHAQRAVSASIEMRRALDGLREKWTAERGPMRFEMGIGLNTGEVFVGLVGSAKRINYTAIGDAVNLASRLQDLTKEFQWPLLVSENTYEKIKDEFEAEFGEARPVRGKTAPVGIYKVLGRKGAPPEERIRPLFA